MCTKKQVAFFFGAGAEGKGNFGMETGGEYLQKTLLASMHEDEGKTNCFTASLKKHFGAEYFGGSYRYTEHKIDASTFLLPNFVACKCSADNEFKNKYKDLVSQFVSEEDFYDIYEEKKVDKDKKQTKLIKKIKGEFQRILTGKIDKYGRIEEEILKDLFTRTDGDCISVDINVGISGLLDSYFHTIINPKKYGVNKFSKVVNYYWSCYFTILRSVLCYLRGHGIAEAGEYLEGESLNYEKVLSNLKQLTDLIYNRFLDVSLDGTYYQYIKENFEKHKSTLACAGVITTNYYQFCSRIAKKTVYLNGQLKLFECPERLEAVDLTNDAITNGTFYFPFLFGQSLVKPIINRQQINEFTKLSAVLKKADVLVIFGFNINEDDNHINAFLHDFATKKKIIVVTDLSPEECKVAKKLKCEGGHIKICTVRYGDNREVVERIFQKIQEETQAEIPEEHRGELQPA